jgi:hypothetical protein
MSKPIAFFDLDDTLCHYKAAVERDMTKLMLPGEGPYVYPEDDAPAYMHNRISSILCNEDWWYNLMPIERTFNLMYEFSNEGFQPHILTAGPKRHPGAWAGKKRWVDRYFGKDIPMTITRDKSLLRGAVLVDDYPKYFLPWLDSNPEGLVFYLDGEQNRDVKHDRAFPFGVDPYVSRENEDIFKKIRGRYV